MYPETNVAAPLNPARMHTRSRMKMTLFKNKWFILVIVFLILWFYWFEVRPISLSRMCATQSSADARALLKSKADVSKGTPIGKEYQSLIDKNLYLRADYESFLGKCLLHYNISKPVLPANAPAEAK